MNPQLTKELLEATNPDGSDAFNAHIIRTFVEIKNDDLIRDCLKTWNCQK